MHQKRKEEVSIYYWLEDNVPDSVNVEDGFPGSTELTLPTVSITDLDIRGERFELGGCEQDIRWWRIDVFANNKAQRNQLRYSLYEELEDHIKVYDYDEGFPPSVSPSQLGTLLVSDRTSKAVHVFEDLVDKLYWRASIVFSTKYQSL